MTPVGANPAPSPKHHIDINPLEITPAIAEKVLALIDQGLVAGLGLPAPGQMGLDAIACYALGLPHSADSGCVENCLRHLIGGLNDCDWSSPQVRARGLRRLGVAQLGTKGVLKTKAFSARVVCHTLPHVSKGLRAVATIFRTLSHHDALCAVAERCERELTLLSYIEAQRILSAAHGDASSIEPSQISQAQIATGAAWVCALQAGRAVDPDSDISDTGRALCALGAAIYAVEVEAQAAMAHPASAKTGDPVTRDSGLAALAEMLVQLLIEMKAPGCRWLELTDAP
jgi:hypothetical protein